MRDLEIGQILWLIIRFNNNNDISRSKHPYLIVSIDDELNAVEIVQIDSLVGKEYKAAMRSNKTIFYDNPTETVLNKDSYAQLDNTLKIEYFDELSEYRSSRDNLSSSKLSGVIQAYDLYHENYEIDERKNVYRDRKEILRMNR